MWDFQNTKFKLADIKAQAAAGAPGRLLHRRAHAPPIDGAGGRDRQALRTETLWKCIDDMVQLHGGYGYMLEYPIARAFIDYRVTRVFGGTSEVQRDLISQNGEPYT